MKRTLLLVIGLWVLLGIGGVVWLKAGPLQRRPVTSAVLPAPMMQMTNEQSQQLQPTPPRFSSSATTSSTTAPQFARSVPDRAATNPAVDHFVDGVSITPGFGVYGSQQPVIITVTITDPGLLPNSVNLLQTFPNGRQSILGNLRDDGLLGDALPGDNTYTIQLSFSTSPPGTISLQISAAFKGMLQRALSSPFTYIVLPSIDTSSWIVLTDPDNTFSIKVPPTWQLSIINVTDTISGQRTAQCIFPDGTPLFMVTVYTHSAWVQAQQDEGPTPIYLGENSTSVFAYTESETDPNLPGVSADVIREQLQEILATFRLL